MQDRTGTQRALAEPRQQVLQFARARDVWSVWVQQKSRDSDNHNVSHLEDQMANTRGELNARQLELRLLDNQRNEALHQVRCLSGELATVRDRRAPGNEPDLFRPRVPEARPGREAAHHGLTIAGGAFLLIVSLLTTDAFRDARNQEAQYSPSGAVTLAALENQVGAGSDAKPADKSKPAPQSGKKKTRYASREQVEYRQWGPALLPAVANAAQPVTQYDPLVQRQQRQLLALGFDLGEADGHRGPRTQQALDEFSALYLGSNDQLTDVERSVIIGSYVSLVQADADRFGIDRGVLAAIRLSSVRTGVSFSYLMKLAATESNFEPDIKSAASSATGLYQFTQDTWLNTVKKHGARYGLGKYAEAIEFYVTRGGYQRPMMRDKVLKEHVLALRKNPRVAAMMAAESVRDHQRKLSYFIKREPTQTDLYLSHFLGTDGAISFLKALSETPDASASSMFPAAAKSNQNIFHPGTSGPRTVDQVYELFGSKFSSNRYDDLALNEDLTE